ncbi:YpiF family protein [Ureibacillus suwonensis]|uniref:YpiF family protein n=1 Tax=Ureibacillus suwonensis TaxID=313007 RepID=A0ABW0R8K2_9BACL
MYFQVKDVQQYQQNKEFIDTAIVPLVSLDFAEDKIVKSSSEAEFLMALTSFIEQQFKGRLMLIPPYSYTEDMKNEKLVQTLKKNIQEGGFKHVIFITCDHFWTKLQDVIDVIWLPAIPIESMDKDVKKRILEEQLKQVLPVLSSKWSQH